MGKNLDVKMVKESFTVVTEWCFENPMISNSEKCHYICLRKTTNNLDSNAKVLKIAKKDNYMY